MRNLVLVSKKHLRYEHKNPTGGLQKCGRAIFIENQDFSEMFSGLPVTPECGFLVRMVNADIRNTDGSYPPMMEPKLMELVSDNGSQIELRGVTLKAFGDTAVDFSQYGLSLYLSSRKVVKCVLHMFDREIDIEYLDID